MEKERTEIDKSWRELNYNWCLDNFSSLMNKNVGQGIVSDRLSIASTKWHFVLHPNGTNQDSRHFVSLWLFNDNQEEFNVEYQVFIGEHLIKVVKANKIKPGQGNGILKLVSHVNILDKNFLNEKGQLILTIKIYQETDRGGENVTLAGMGDKEENYEKSEPKKVLKKLDKNVENPAGTDNEDPLAINTNLTLSEAQDSNTAGGVKSKVFLSPRDPPDLTQRKPSLIVPSKTYSKKVSTPTKKPLAFFKAPIIPNTATCTKTLYALNLKSQPCNTSNLIVVKKQTLTASNISTIPVKVFKSGQIKYPKKDPSNVPKSNITLIPESQSAIDLPKNEFSSTVTRLPIPNDATDDIIPNDDTDDAPELPDDTFDPIMQTAGKVSPNEPVAELLKIVKNLPSQDQILFIKLLVLQLNDEMLKLIRILSDSLQNEGHLTEIQKEKEILKYESRRRIADDSKLFEEPNFGNNETVNVKEEVNEVDKIDIDEFILEPSQVEFKKLDVRIKRLPVKIRESIVVEKLLPNEDANSVKDVDSVLEKQDSRAYTSAEVIGGERPWRFDSTLDLENIKENQDSMHDKQKGERLVEEQSDNINIDIVIQNSHPNISKAKGTSTHEKCVSDLPVNIIQSGPIYACAKCDELFDCSEKRSKHQRKHCPSYKGIFETPIVCDQCPKIIKTRDGWNSHMQWHQEENSEEKDIQCEHCPMRFHLESTFLKHVYYKHTEIACKKCGTMFLGRTALEKHERKKHNDPSKPKPFPCDQCSKAFLYRHSLDRHKITHTQERPHPCNICEKSFRSRNELKEHSACHGNEKKFKCKDCNKAFKFQACLYRHRKTWHCTDLPFKCDKCPKRFAIPSFLNQHKLIHLDNSQRPFVCDKCGHGFLTKQVLKMHLENNCSKPGYRKRDRRKGPTEGPICIVDCNICGKPLNKRNLKSHLATHSSPTERLYSCEQCNKSFSTTNNLKEHSIVHSTDRSYSCEKCGKSFVSKRRLAQHIRSHNKPHHCNQCKKSFSRNASLLYHLRTHTGEKQYSCDQCSKSFYFQRSMKKHQEKFHSDKFEATNQLDENVVIDNTWFNIVVTTGD